VQQQTYYSQQYQPTYCNQVDPIEMNPNTASFYPAQYSDPIEFSQDSNQVAWRNLEGAHKLY